MTHVAFGGVIKSDEHKRFVFPSFFAGAVMKLNELVFQHPLAAHSTFNRAAVAHFAGNAPVADEIIEKRILKRRGGPAATRIAVPNTSRTIADLDVVNMGN